MIRSFLFVPADSERKMAKAEGVPADALILDLEDAVAAERRATARELARRFIASAKHAWVRINPLDTDDAEKDLAAVMQSAPAGIVLPKPRGANDARRLADMLDVLEERHDVAPRSTRILALCTERPEALFTLGDYRGATTRLWGLSWGAEDLAAAVGATGNRDEAGDWLPPYQLARSLCLFGAAAAGVPAIDTVYTDFRDLDGLAASAGRARRDGFAGMLAIHPEQVGTINEAFMPSPAEIERAQRIVDAFAASPEAGTLGIDGEMIDRPHLLQARRIVKLAGTFKTDDKRGTTIDD